MLGNHRHLVLAVSEFLNLVNGPWLLPPKLIAREGYDAKCLSVVLLLEVLQLTIVDIRKPTIRCYVYYQKHLEVSAVSVSVRVPIFLTAVHAIGRVPVPLCASHAHMMMCMSVNMFMSV